MAKPTESTEWAGHVDALVTATDSARWNYGWTTPSNDPSGVGEKPNLNQQNYWQNAVHKWIEYLEDTIELHDQAVGTLEQSFLTEAQYHAQAGRDETRWVRADGRDVTGSAYAALTLLTTVPNVEGRYLRDSTGSDAGLKTTQANQSGAHNHTLSGNGGAAYRYDSYVAEFGFVWQYKESTATLDFNGGLNEYRADPWSATDAITGTDVGTGLALFGVTDGISAQTTETRPDSIIVNTFIKIN